MLISDQVKDAEIIDKNNGRDGSGSWEESLCVVSIRKPNSLNDLNDSFISFQLILRRGRLSLSLLIWINSLVYLINFQFSKHCKLKHDWKVSHCYAGGNDERLHLPQVGYGKAKQAQESRTGAGQTLESLERPHTH